LVKMTLRIFDAWIAGPTSMAPCSECVRPQEGRTKGGPMWNHPEGT